MKAARLPGASALALSKIMLRRLRDPPEDLGNLAVEPARSVRLNCDRCQVTWRGCAAESCCPRCGDGMDTWYAPGPFDGPSS